MKRKKFGTVIAEDVKRAVDVARQRPDLSRGATCDEDHADLDAVLAAALEAGGSIPDLRERMMADEELRQAFAAWLARALVRAERSRM